MIKTYAAFIQTELLSLSTAVFTDTDVKNESFNHIF